jgi:hypothetical protein
MGEGARVEYAFGHAQRDCFAVRRAAFMRGFTGTYRPVRSKMNPGWGRFAAWHLLDETSNRKAAQVQRLARPGLRPEGRIGDRETHCADGVGAGPNQEVNGVIG